MWRWMSKIRLSPKDRFFKRQKIPEAEVSGLPDISAIVPMVEVEHVVVPPLAGVEADFGNEDQARRKTVRDIFDKYSVSMEDARSAEKFINK